MLTPNKAISSQKNTRIMDLNKFAEYHKKDKMEWLLRASLVHTLISISSLRLQSVIFNHRCSLYLTIQIYLREIIDVVSNIKVNLISMLMSNISTAEKQNMLEMINDDLDSAYMSWFQDDDLTDPKNFANALYVMEMAVKENFVSLQHKVLKVITPYLSDNWYLIKKEAPVFVSYLFQLQESFMEMFWFRTVELLNHPLFFKDIDILLHIVQQECLAIPEISLWRAALNWARYQVTKGSEEVDASMLVVEMRKTLLPLLKHIRFCTLSPDQLQNEVIPSQILSEEEVSHIFMSLKNRERINQLVHICNAIEERKYQSLLSDQELVTYFHNPFHDIEPSRDSRITVQVMESYDVELRGIVCFANRTSRYVCNGKVSISCKSSTPIIIPISEEVALGKLMFIPLKDSSGHFVTLKSNTAYAIDCYFTEPHRSFVARPGHYCQISNGLEIKFHPNNIYSSHIKMMFYKVLSP